MAPFEILCRFPNLTETLKDSGFRQDQPEEIQALHEASVVRLTLNNYENSNLDNPISTDFISSPIVTKKGASY